MRTRFLLAIGTLSLLAAVGCSDNEDPSPAPSAAGTTASFDAAASFEGAAFYDFPFPSDLRRTADGAPDFSGFPFPADNAIVDTALPGAMNRPGFALATATYFRFSAPLAPLTPDDATFVRGADDSPPNLYLLDVDADSPERGRIVPTVGYTVTPGVYAPEHLLAVAPHPGIPLRPGTTYAAVVQADFGDATGAPLGTPAALAALAAGERPEGATGTALADLYQPLWDTLAAEGIAPESVAAASVFTTGDVVGQTARWGDAVVANHDVTFGSFAIDPDDGADHERFCELHATVTMPQFQAGTAPFRGADEADIVIVDDAPARQSDETFPIAITIPKGPMPADGYPLVVYVHGSGGVFTQVVDRGPQTEPDGPQTPGEGPAHVVARHGLAAVGAAMPVSPDRVPDVGDFDYALNTTNVDAFPGNFRQGVFEQRLLIEAMASLEIDPAALTGCDGPSLPPGATSYRFDLSRLALMGQSMGAQYANMIAATEPAVRVLVPTGAGGPWTLMFLESDLFGGLDRLVGGLFGIEPEETWFAHPGVNMLHHAWEPGDAYSYVSRIARDPLPGHPARPTFQTSAPGDLFWAPRVYDAMALAYGHDQAGSAQWDSMQSRLALEGRDGFVDYPVGDNRTAADGTPYTGVVVQYAPLELGTPHGIFGQSDEIKHQYGCFLASFIATGTATLPAPAPTGTACPGVPAN
ncbi:MAG: hypothetical protein AAF928_01620 [Myxococcota bacterium]